MKRLLSAAALAIVALVSTHSISAAQATKWSIDGAHSVAGFEVRHIFTKVPGRFTDLAGTIVYDAKDVSKSSVEATIQSKSVFTANERRDNHLRSADFFDVEKFPTITFKSTKVTPATDKTFKIEGDFTMKGVTKKVVLDATFLGAGDFGMGGNKMGVKSGFEARTKIDRKDYGIVWNKALDAGGMMLSDEVDIVLTIEADQVVDKAAN
jgi:polyisoprenoid-binding protein YceI